MKKLMLGAAIAATAITFANPSFAREVKQVVGYVHTTETVSQLDNDFHKMDASRDGAINFKEFQRGTHFEHPYEMFKMNDTNNDDLLTIEEFRNFSKFGPARVSGGQSSPSMTYYNFNNKPNNK